LVVCALPNKLGQGNLAGVIRNILFPDLIIWGEWGTVNLEKLEKRGIFNLRTGDWILIKFDL